MGVTAVWIVRKACIDMSDAVGGNKWPEVGDSTEGCLSDLSALPRNSFNVLC